MTRYERKRKGKALRKAVLVLFIFIVPLTAIAASVFLMNLYDKGSGMIASTNGVQSNSVSAFKYNYEIESRTLYRIELKDFDSFEEAEAFIKSIKAKKLNGFVVKENGYKVIYGVFDNMDEALKVKESIAAKIEGSISEIKLQGYSLKYNEEDNTFIQLVQATDKLIRDITKAKSQASCEIAVKSKKDMGVVLEEISLSEVKLEKYLGYAEKYSVPAEQKVFRENFVMLLEDVLAHKLDSAMDYYNAQESLLNQIEAYRRFIGKLII